MRDLKDLSHRIYKEVMENGDLTILDDVLTEDVIEHEGIPGVDLPPGREGAKQSIKAWVQAFGPMTVDIHAQYQEGDVVINRVVFHGKHVGEFAGMPPTNKRFDMEVIDIMRFEGDRIAEHWGQSDTMGMMVQLGLMEPPG